MKYCLHIDREIAIMNNSFQIYEAIYEEVYMGHYLLSVVKLSTFLVSWKVIVFVWNFGIHSSNVHTLQICNDQPLIKPVSKQKFNFLSPKGDSYTRTPYNTVGVKK